jgi:hypothetical protein
MMLSPPNTTVISPATFSFCHTPSINTSTSFLNTAYSACIQHNLCPPCSARLEPSHSAHKSHCAVLSDRLCEYNREVYMSEALTRRNEYSRCA